MHEINIAGLSHHAFIGLGEFGYPILRNLIEATYGKTTSFARLYGATLLYHANIKEDVDDLPWLPEFFKRLNYLANSVKSGTRLEIKSLYTNIRKRDVFEIASEMGLEQEIIETWSCLRNEGHHCGVCKAWLRRKQTFEKAGIKDETIYLRDK